MKGDFASVGIPGAQATRPLTGLPHRAVGWWAFGLLLVVGLFPLWWAIVNRFVDNVFIMTVVSAGLAVPAFLCSREAIFRKKDPSFAVNVLFFLVASEVVIGVFFALALLGQALN